MFFRTANENDSRKSANENNSADEYELADSEIDETVLAIVEKPSKPIKGINIDISVSHPKKVGSGITAYLLFTVTTKSTTNLIVLKKAETSVQRRFPDFIALHDKLISKHRPSGILVPPAPEKNIIGKTLAKMNAMDEEDLSTEFAEQRRSTSERFLNRIARHPLLCKDVDFLTFLEHDGLLSTSISSILVPAGLKKFMSGVLSKTVLFNSNIMIQEKDNWFKTMRNLIEGLVNHTSSLHEAYDNQIVNHKDVAGSMTEVAGALTIAGAAEEDDSFTRIMCLVADALVKLGSLHQEQADIDQYSSSEIFNDHLKIWDEIKEILHIREELYLGWVESGENLDKMKSNVLRMEVNEREHEASQCRVHAKDLEIVEHKKKLDFRLFSRCAKVEIQRFEKDYVTELRHVVLMFLYQMIKSLELTIDTWEAFLPETAV